MRPFTPEECETILALRAEGKSLPQIAAELGRQASCVWKKLYQLTHPKPPQKPGPKPGYKRAPKDKPLIRRPCYRCQKQAQWGNLYCPACTEIFRRQSARVGSAYGSQQPPLAIRQGYAVGKV